MLDWLIDVRQQWDQCQSTEGGNPSGDKAWWCVLQSHLHSVHSLVNNEGWYGDAGDNLESCRMHRRASNKLHCAALLLLLEGMVGHINTDIAPSQTVAEANNKGGHYRPHRFSNVTGVCNKATLCKKGLHCSASINNVLPRTLLHGLLDFVHLSRGCRGARCLTLALKNGLRKEHACGPQSTSSKQQCSLPSPVETCILWPSWQGM
mmetsp:Transcript_62304/g.148754  ORF Transcript_62304/g.148754 Transcript_62304/m.148754 type:complete len:206 (+) Transcript_62304:204-821(+)